MKSFFKEAVGTLKTSGTLKPSSKYLIRDCLKDLSFKEAKVIVEFGPGNGCITGEIVNKIDKNARLYAFEINPKFYSFCKTKFRQQTNVQIINASAFEFDQFLTSESIQKVDFIISSLPLTLFKDEEISEFLQKVKKHLQPGGAFVQYQYSLGKYRELKKLFDGVDIDLTLRNFPPAFIYKCHK